MCCWLSRWENDMIEVCCHKENQYWLLIAAYIVSFAININKKTGQTVFAGLHQIVCQGCFKHLRKTMTNAGFFFLLRTDSHKVSCGLNHNTFSITHWIQCDEMIAGCASALIRAIDCQAAELVLLIKLHCLCRLLWF